MTQTPSLDNVPAARQPAAVTGRPTTYNQATADLICLRMAEGETLRQICRDKALPARSTVYRWLSRNPEFADQYAQARELLVAAWADEILDIADDGTTDYVTKVGRNGAEYEAVDQEHIQRSRLRVDARRWLLSKLNPGQYGDHVEVEHSGAVDHRLHISDTEKVRRLALFLLQSPAGTTIEGQASPIHASNEDDQPAEE